MNIPLLVFLRFVHLVAGILWTGAAITYVLFVKPSVKSIGATGPEFMQHMTGRRKYPIFMMGTSLLTIVAGGILYWFTSGRLNPGWITSGVGLGFTIGSVASLIAFFIGALGIGPASGQISALFGQIAASGNGPSPDQMDRIHSLDKKVSRLENVEFVLMLIALVTMATARYWWFI